MNQTPTSIRIHIAFFGRTNSGKSSLVNAITGQDISLVSEVGGTTTDPVYKNMELHPLGAAVLIDTAGFDDDTELGALRVRATGNIIDKTDVGVVVFADSAVSGKSKISEESDNSVNPNITGSAIDISMEKEWVEMLRKNGIPTVAVINKIDTLGPETGEAMAEEIRRETGIAPVLVSAKTGESIDKAIEAIVKSAKVERERSICGHLIDEGDIVLLVMPQDIQAPKGRLIMPQVQTIRDLLDHRCIVISTGIDNLKASLDMLKHPPKLMITDSQIFPKVREMKPEETELTSFSVLFSKYKGDIDIFLEGANALGRLRKGDKVLIAEACTHNAQDGDIARVKIPNMLRKRVGEVKIEVVSGPGLPDDLSDYSVMIHCGACMFNRKHVMTRIQRAQEAGVPITNYGLAIAYLNNMMDSIIY